MVNETILKNELNEGVTQASLKKTFQPIATKLDDVAMTNLKIPNLRQKKKVTKVPDYGLAIGDDEELDEFNLQNLYDEGVLPDTQKQIVPRPPSYEESSKDILEGKKQIYVDPQYFPEEPLDLPPEYDEDEKLIILWKRKTM